jgi:phosphatidylglycerol:prolipoprotein diacylglycerol transferase
MSLPNGIVPTTGPLGVCLQSGWPENCAVHPTPIYEFLIGLVIFWILWRLGARGLQTKMPNGVVFAAYLVLSGIARFLIEIIRINPRSFLGMTNAQNASIASVLAGAVLYAYLRKPQAAPRRA